MDTAAALEQLSDSEIVGRVRGGERAAYAEIIRRYESRLRALLSFYFHSRHELEEHLQDAFVQAYLALEHCDAGAPFYPWLRGIALNLLRMEFRRLQTARKRGADYLRYVQLQRLERDPEGLDAESRADALRGCLAKLGEDDARLIQARYGEECAVKVLAERLATTEGALKVRLLRLRHALRGCIQMALLAGRS